MDTLTRKTDMKDDNGVPGFIFAVCAGFALWAGWNGMAVCAALFAIGVWLNGVGKYIKDRE